MIKSGKEDTLKNLTRKDLQDTYNKIYSCKDIVITVVGNIKKNEVKKVLEKYFGSMVLSSENIKTVSQNKTERPVKDTVVPSKFNQAFIIYAYDVPDVLNKDFVNLLMFIMLHL